MSEIVLPSGGTEGFGSTDPFTHFVIFYRIYMSTVGSPPDPVTSSQDRSTINSLLNTDFNTIFPWTDPTNTSVNASGVMNFFNGRGFVSLELDEATIGGRNGVLGANALGKALRMDFANVAGERPSLSLGGVQYFLRRASSSQRFPEINPQPERDGIVTPPFLNFFEEMRVRRDDFNADVATTIPTGSEHAYVLMYIAAAGADGVPPVAVFSQPTFLGIFRLPGPL